MKKIACIAFLLLTFTNSYAQKFEDYFENKTLRVDYIFTGNAKQGHLSGMNSHSSLHGPADNIIWTNCRWKETDRLLSKTCLQKSASTKLHFRPCSRMADDR